MNVAIILGRLTRDPAIKASQSGMTIAPSRWRSTD